MLKEILSISGKSGLYKLISQKPNIMIVESLLDGKRSPAYSSDKVVSLADIAMFTLDSEVHLNEVLKKVLEKEKAAPCQLDVKAADNDTLRAYFAEVIPNYDRDRVYPSDIRKLILWYNILVNAGLTDFDNVEDTQEGKPAVELKETTQKAQAKPTANAKVQDKKMQSTKGTRTKV
ncbi:MAG: DUF5606 domain-containing protein [Prevotellaceae bacterium]|jgi:hypothetical protein|nr:DUF5606 domain-containing protein [Prevotellaceae bacterium]